MADRNLLDVDDVAALLGVSARRVKSLIRSAGLPVITLPGNVVRVDEHALWGWVDSHSAPVSEPAGEDRHA